MCSGWKRGLKKWPHLLASLAFVISTGFAIEYGMERTAAAEVPHAVEWATIPAAAGNSVVPSLSKLAAHFSDVLASIESVGAVFWPLVTLLALLLMLRLGAAIAGIGYDCGRLLLWATAIIISELQLPWGA